jgi:hypothetical protein
MPPQETRALLARKRNIVNRGVKPLSQGPAVAVAHPTHLISSHLIPSAMYKFENSGAFLPKEGGCNPIHQSSDSREVKKKKNVHACVNRPQVYCHSGFGIKRAHQQLRNRAQSWPLEMHQGATKKKGGIWKDPSRDTAPSPALPCNKRTTRAVRGRGGRRTIDTKCVVAESCTVGS